MKTAMTEQRRKFFQGLPLSTLRKHTTYCNKLLAANPPEHIKERLTSDKTLIQVERRRRSCG